MKPIRIVHKTILVVVFSPSVWAYAAQPQFGLFRASANAGFGYESNTLILPSPDLGEPQIGGWAYSVGASVEPVFWGPASLVVSASVVGFQLKAALEQSQFGQLQTGEFSTNMTGFEGGLGVNYRLPVFQIPLSIQAETFYQQSISGTFAAKIGFIEFSEKIKSMGRFGAGLSCSYSFSSRLSASLKGTYYSGALSSESTSGESVLAQQGTAGEAKLKGYGAMVGVSWHFLVPRVPSSKNAAATKKGQSVPKASVPQNQTPTKETP